MELALNDIFNRRHPVIASSGMSFFRRPVINTTPHIDLDMYSIYELVVGTEYKNRTHFLRAITSKPDAKKFKSRNFDFVTFSGRFAKRSARHLIDHSGYMVIDFDDLPDPTLVKEALLHDIEIETELAFISPSGNGLKWIIAIELENLTHSQYFTAVCNYIEYTYSFKPDRSGSDVSRSCFLCHDSQAFIHPKYLSNDL